MSHPLANDPIFFRLRGPALPPGDEARRMLGRVVRNFAQPLGAGYQPEDMTTFHIGTPTETKWLRASDLFSRSASGAVELKLSGVGGVKLELGNSEGFSLQSSEILALELRHQPEVYHKLATDVAVGPWIQANCTASQPLFMITGLLVWRDAKQKEVVAHKVAGNASVQIPTASALTGGALQFGSPGDVKPSTSGQTSRNREQQRENEDSHVFAIQYKVVRRRKRDLLSRFAPTLQNYGPSVDADRQYASGEKTTEAASNQAASLDQDNPPELELGLSWMDVVEEMGYADKVHTDLVDTESMQLEFVTVEGLSET